MDIVFKSIAAGVATAIILTLAKFSGPKLAGAIGGLPIVFAVSYILIAWQSKAPPQRDFLVGGIFGALAAILFSLVLMWLNAQYNKNYWFNFTIAYLLCFLSAFGLAYFSTPRS